VKELLDIGGAVEALLDGKRVARVDWPRGKWWKMFDKRIYLKHSLGGYTPEVWFTDEEVLAEDYYVIGDEEAQTCDFMLLDLRKVDADRQANLRKHILSNLREHVEQAVA
jgi:hypothetical protein